MNKNFPASLIGQNLVNKLEAYKNEMASLTREGDRERSYYEDDLVSIRKAVQEFWRNRTDYRVQTSYPMAIADPEGCNFIHLVWKDIANGSVFYKSAISLNVMATSKACREANASIKQYKEGMLH
jgi:hypothetical protein